ncbi:MAG: UDP-glucose 4-epimerase GalE [Chloroflexota bacterium]|nr:UDP-glucose 4-epimerase GalE [Chloroflexota bacterium]
MRILVTGGAGYIGSIAAEALVRAGHKVVVLDNLWRGHAAAVPREARLIRCDLRDEDGIREAVSTARPDAVLHFAAATLVSESVNDPEFYFRNNLGGMLNLLTAMRSIDCRRIVFSSSAAVYGDPSTLPVSEEAVPNPVNPYGQTKLMGERLLEAFETAYGLQYAALRYFNVAGASESRGEDHDPETHVIPVALNVLRDSKQAFSIYGTDYPTGDGTAIRDYVHVEDLVEAHLLALDNVDQRLGAINLGTKSGFSVKEIVDGIEQTTGKTLPVTLGPRRAGDPPALIADSTRARQRLGWEPRRSTLPQMIGSAWEWMQSHPSGYEKD